MAEATLLVAMQRIVSGIQVEPDLAWRLGARIKKQIDQQRVDGIENVGGDPGIAGGFRPAEFQAVERALAGQRSAIAAAGGKLAGQHCHHWVMAQFVMADQVLITKRDATIRCVTSVCTLCSTKSPLRLCLKPAAKRRVNPMTRSAPPAATPRRRC